MKPYSMTVPNVFPVLAFSFAGLVAVFTGYIATSMPMFISIGIVLGVSAAILTFLKPQIGLGLIIFSMLLSPEISMGQLARRAIIVRFDDLLLIGVFIAWFTRAAVYKELPSFSKIPLMKPISLYAGICIVSTILGIIRGDLKPLTSFFYVAKYLEYFLLYFMVFSVVSNMRQVKGYLWAGLITVIIVCLHAYYQMNQGLRPYAPFDIEQGTVETASLAGYLMIIVAVALALFIHTKNFSNGILFLGIIVFMLPPFLNSESRASYISIIPMIISLVLFGRRRRLALSGIIVMITIMVTFFAPQTVQKIYQRVSYTFVNPYQKYSIAGTEVGLEESAASRVESWENIFRLYLQRHPWVGHGIMGVGFVDTTYPLLIGEVGIFGFCSFMWIIFSIFYGSRHAYLALGDPVIKSMNLALFVITIGLCVQAFAVSTFIIIRIMEPFWFLAGMTLKSNQLESEQFGVKVKKLTSSKLANPIYK